MDGEFEESNKVEKKEKPKKETRKVIENEEDPELLAAAGTDK